MWTLELNQNSVALAHFRRGTWKTTFFFTPSPQPPPTHLGYTGVLRVFWTPMQYSKHITVQIECEHWDWTKSLLCALQWTWIFFFLPVVIQCPDIWSGDICKLAHNVIRWCLICIFTCEIQETYNAKVHCITASNNISDFHGDICKLKILPYPALCAFIMVV